MVDDLSLLLICACLKHHPLQLSMRVSMDLLWRLEARRHAHTARRTLTLKLAWLRWTSEMGALACLLECVSCISD